MLCILIMCLFFNNIYYPGLGDFQYMNFRGLVKQFRVKHLKKNS